MINKTEKEIMKNWKPGDQIMVNVACFTFNHEYGVIQALDSFLMQETSFPFQVFINDDVSTDDTIDIIKQYEKNYPNIVKPVLQSENQFSQGINPMSLLFPQLKGKYVALCEGDDYWTDNKKLQIQVDLMEDEKYSEVDLCFHPAYKLVDDMKEEVISKHSDNNSVFTLKEVIRGGGNFCPTASLLLRSHLTSSLAKSDWYHKAIPGDYLTQVMGSASGGALFINRCMSIYRVGNAGSWTSNLSTEDSQKKKNALFANNKRLKQVSKILDNKFQTEIDQVVSNYNYAFVKMKSTDLSVRKEVYSACKEGFSIKQKLKWFFLYRNGRLRNLLSLIKSKILPVT